MPQPPPEKPDSNGKPPNATVPLLRQCIQACQKCHLACTSFALAQASANSTAGKTEPDLLKMLRICAQACHTCSDFMIRDSPLSRYLCRACAEFCEACLDAHSNDQSGTLKMDDKRLQDCLDACRQCAKSCRMIP